MVCAFLEVFGGIWLKFDGDFGDLVGNWNVFWGNSLRSHFATLKKFPFEVAFCDHKNL